MSASTGTCKQLRIREHEVVSHTASSEDGRHCCLVFLLDPYGERRDLKVFKAFGATVDQAEAEGVERALQYLRLPEAQAGDLLEDRNTMNVGGHVVDIFCDVIADGRYQAFPFLIRPDGSRALIMQFHLREAVTAETPSGALTRCIHRLEEYFTRLGRKAS